MPTEIDTRISPALHPDNVSQIDGYDPEDRDIVAVLAPTVTAFSAAYESLKSIHAAKAAADKNPGWTEEARLVQVDNFARKHLDKITRTFDATRTNIVRGIAYIEAELSQPIKSLAGSFEAGEIRAYVAKLSTSERQSFIQNAIDAGDEESVSAILGAKHYLSGMTAEMQQILLRHWHMKQNPDKARRLKLLQGAQEWIERDAGKVFGEIEKARGGSSAAAKKVREAQSAAEKALSF